MNDFIGLEGEGTPFRARSSALLLERGVMLGGRGGRESGRMDAWDCERLGGMVGTEREEFEREPACEGGLGGFEGVRTA